LEKSPDAFRTISEAAEELDLPQHVLRFWETRFSQIKPLKRGGGRRYYRPDDVQLLKGIRHLLYDQGFTIKGVQRILKEQGARHVIAIGETGSTLPIAAQPHPDTDPDGDSDIPNAEFVELSDEGRAPTPPPSVASEPVRPELSQEHRDRLSAALAILEECRALLDRTRT